MFSEHQSFLKPILIFGCEFIAWDFIIMRLLLLLSFTAFSSTIADPAADDTGDLIFPTGAQPLGGDISWNGPDVDLGFATGDLGSEVSGDDSLGLFDEGSNSEYLGYGDDVFIPAMDDSERPGFEFGSVCSMNEGSSSGKVRRENQCSSKENSQEPKDSSKKSSLSLISGPIAPTPDTKDGSASTEESGSKEPEPEPQPLSSSLLGVPFGALCPPDKVPGKVPLCCEDHPYRSFVRNCINCEFALPRSLYLH